MAKNGQVTAEAVSVTKLPRHCHLKIKMTRNHQNNVRNEFNVPKSVELDILHMYTLNNKHNTVFNVHHGQRQPYLIWP